jgi:D-lactate dehydrogenase
MPACVNRIFGRARGAAAGPTVPEALVALSLRAGRRVWIPDDVAGHCCGTPWSSKGYPDGLAEMIARGEPALSRWTDDGRLALVIDASSCTLGAREHLAGAGVTVLDSVQWCHDVLLERISIVRRHRTLLLHPTCAVTALGIGGELAELAARIADEVTVPLAARCCGMAGDRGLLHPELPAAALAETEQELAGRTFDACVSSNRTCEIALAQVTGRRYESIVTALEWATRT